MTAIALEVCEVLRFDSRDFNRLVPPKSDFYNRIQAIARKRIEDIERIEVEEASATYTNRSENSSWNPTSSQIYLLFYLNC